MSKSFGISNASERNPWAPCRLSGGKLETPASARRSLWVHQTSLSKRSVIMRIVRTVAALTLLAALFWSCWPASTLAQESTAETPAAAGETPATPPAPEPKPLDRGDNAWMLTSSALVLMMTGPGLAMFYCGLVRKKNVLSVIMQCFFLMGLMSIVWALWGYSLAFGGSEAGIGNGDYLLMK